MDKRNTKNQPERAEENPIDIRLRGRAISICTTSCANWRDAMADVTCPCCGLHWDEPGCEQAACIELFGECIPCRFLPAGKGSRSGSIADMDRIVARRKEMLVAASAGNAGVGAASDAAQHAGNADVGMSGE